MKTISALAMRGISTYLARRGFDIIEEGWAHGKDSIDFIARDDDDLVFIATKVAKRSDEDLAHMGLVGGWQECVFWKSITDGMPIRNKAQL